MRELKGYEMSAAFFLCTAREHIHPNGDGVDERTGRDCLSCAVCRADIVRLVDGGSVLPNVRDLGNIEIADGMDDAPPAGERGEDAKRFGRRLEASHRFHFGAWKMEHGNRWMTDEEIEETWAKIAGFAFAALRPADAGELKQERYWCGCVREARWTRCERHGALEHDEEPKTRAQEADAGEAVASTVMAILRWQRNSLVHPLTCGNDSDHRLLFPWLDDEHGGSVVLCCPDCDYRQTHIPAMFAHPPQASGDEPPDEDRVYTVPIHAHCGTMGCQGITEVSLTPRQLRSGMYRTSGASDDTRRLDWLQKHCWLDAYPLMRRFGGNSLRDAVDAAMSAAPQGER